MSASRQTLAFWVTPNAKKNQLVGIMDGAFRIKIAAKPEDHKANQELIRFIAEVVGGAQRDFALLSGATSRRKVLAYTGPIADLASLVKRQLESNTKA